MIKVDSSVYSNLTPTNFQVWDVTNLDSTFKIEFRFRDGTQTQNKKGSLSHGDKLQLVSKYSEAQRTWFFDINVPGFDTLEANEIIYPVEGDVLKITSKKPFDRNDKFTFTLDGNYVESSKIKKDLSFIEGILFVEKINIWTIEGLQRVCNLKIRINSKDNYDAIQIRVKELLSSHFTRESDLTVQLDVAGS